MEKGTTPCQAAKGGAVILGGRLFLILAYSILCASYVLLGRPQWKSYAPAIDLAGASGARRLAPRVGSVLQAAWLGGRLLSAGCDRKYS
mmetsp:Transcript_4971/g.15131  ORF Transcript_4971/g.15131 Transcript_4971/m.15131 type:complete len:89 (+) Transcript_4971:491-757(+)|eukprot:scaffold308967_cov39-Tisochrysis_lutea.AAC.2